MKTNGRTRNIPRSGRNGATRRWPTCTTPGSVFKVITASAALDSGAANLNTSYTCKGSITVGGRTMRCAHTNHGTLDFFGGLDGSCNPYYVTLGQMMGAETFCNYMQAFGFYEKTGVDMDDEGTTQYVPLERMGPVELASSAFGQTTSTTPIQMITAAWRRHQRRISGTAARGKAGAGRGREYR